MLFKAQGRLEDAEEFVYILSTSFLSMNIIIFAHTFVKTTRYLHWDLRVREMFFITAGDLCVRATEHHNIECSTFHRTSHRHDDDSPQNVALSSGEI